MSALAPNHARVRCKRTLELPLGALSPTFGCHAGRPDPTESAAARDCRSARGGDAVNR